MANGDIRRVTLDNLPLDRFDAAVAMFQSHCTALIRNGDLAGSGTFVQYGRRRGILTASHVATRCSPPFDFSPGSTDRLGMGVADMPHAFEIEMQHLVPHSIGCAQTDEFGPDLLFLEIPESASQLHTILARRQFWNLTIRPDERIRECSTDEGCVWVTIGHPHERLRQMPASHGFDEVRGFPGIVGFTGVETIHDRAGLDYFDVYADYRGEGDIPRSFRGVSGGSLWRVPVSVMRADDPIESLVVGSPVLAGVLFYQGPVENGRRLLRAHGPRSIYRAMVQTLSGPAS